MKSIIKFSFAALLLAPLIGCKPGPITLGGPAIPVVDSQNHVSYVSSTVDKKRVVTVPKSGGPSLITNKISAAFAQDKTLSPYKIGVQTDHHGFVTLTGAVPNDQTRSYAIKVARYTKGVVAVSAKNLVVTNQ